MWVHVISFPRCTLEVLEEGAGPDERGCHPRVQTREGAPQSPLVALARAKRQINRNHPRFSSPEIPFSPLFSPSTTILSFFWPFFDCIFIRSISIFETVVISDSAVCLTSMPIHRLTPRVTPFPLSPPSCVRWTRRHWCIDGCPESRGSRIFSLDCQEHLRLTFASQVLFTFLNFHSSPFHHSK